MRAAISALTCVVLLFVLPGVGWSQGKPKPAAAGKKRVYRDVDGRIEVTITERKGATWDVTYRVKDREGNRKTGEGTYGSKSGRLRGGGVDGQWNEKTQTLELTVGLPEGITQFAGYLNGVKPKVKEAPPATDHARWTGKWVLGAYRYSLSVTGGVLEGPFKAEFNDNDPRHSDVGKMKSKRRDGEEFIGEWDSDYSDGEKAGKRSGTFTLKLVQGATAAEDRIVGEMEEVGDAMKKANPGTSMYPGRKYAISMKREP